MKKHSAHKWIQGAKIKKGALTAKAKKAGVSLSKFESQKHRSAKTRRQVALAKTFKKMRHG